MHEVGEQSQGVRDEPLVHGKALAERSKDRREAAEVLEVERAQGVFDSDRD